MFGCGIDWQTFEEKFNNLSEDERQRIERVASRVWLSLLFRYDLQINPESFAITGGLWRQFTIRSIEIPSIEVYLLVSCLDTIAGNPKFQDFDQWLSHQDIVSNFNKDNIINLYQEYKENFGISKNLKYIFSNLPYSTTEWLHSNVRFRKISDPRMQQEESSSKLLEHLFLYYYDLRRNEFTHGSKPQQTWIGDDIYNPTEKSLWVTPASGTQFALYKKKPNQKYCFSFRQGIDEATILRVIIHSVVLQKMGFDVTERLLQENIGHYSRVHAFRTLIYEVRYNAWILDATSKYKQQGYEQMVSYIYEVGIPTLLEQATEIAINRFEVNENALETGLQQISIDYFDAVKKINALINNFNEINPPHQNNESRTESISKFVDELLNSPYFDSLTNWPSKVEMTNLWLVICDPCYSG